MEFLLVLLDGMEFLNTPFFDAKDFQNLLSRLYLI